jgi:membrane dipeptidase
MTMPQYWIDGHLDLGYLAVCGRDLRSPCTADSGGCISLPALREAGVRIAFGTIYTAPGDAGPAGYPSSEDADAAERRALEQLDVYRRLESTGEISIVRTRADLTFDGPLPKIVLLMEGADPIRSPDYADHWFDWGVRIVGLTWSAGTRYAGGNRNGGPLTKLGIELVHALDRCGIAHDASHLSDAAFDGLLEHASGPVVATHSNARALLDENERHLRDDQIRAIAAQDGIVGLNLFTRFLALDRRATIDDCITHVEHVANVMGHRRGIALGSDMDGGFGPGMLPEGLDHPRYLQALADALLGHGFADDDVTRFAHGNWRRFLERILPEH